MVFYITLMKHVSTMLSYKILSRGNDRFIEENTYLFNCVKTIQRCNCAFMSIPSIFIRSDRIDSLCQTQTPIFLAFSASLSLSLSLIRSLFKKMIKFLYI